MELGKGALAQAETSGAVFRAIPSAGEMTAEDMDDHVEAGEIALVLDEADRDDELPCVVGERTVWVPRAWQSLLRKPTGDWNRASRTKALPAVGVGRAIERYLAATASSLRHDLGTLWPATDGNEIAEANVVLHLGAVLRSRRLRVYAEVPLVGERTAHIDLLAFNHRMVLGVEAKRLYSSEKAAHMAYDYGRLVNESIATSSGGPPVPANGEAVALLVATTWNAPIHRWWISEKRAELGRMGNGWWVLAEVLDDIGPSRVGAHPILADPESTRTQWLLYAYKERTKPFMPAARSTRLRGNR